MTEFAVEQAMAEHEYLTVDVFTDRRFGGNPLAVFPDARGIDDVTMQALAAELNYSETTFVLPPEDPANTARVRIFNRSAEMPFAGHPNVGTAFALARFDQSASVLRFEEQAGLVEVRLLARDGVVHGAEIDAPQPLSLMGELPVDAIAACLSLAPGDIDVARHAPVRASVGVDFVLVGVVAGALARALPDIGAYRRLAAQTPGLERRLSIFLYEQHGEDVRARMFAPLAGTWEDAATGSANATLAALRLHLSGAETITYCAVQGVEMGRESHLTLRAWRTPEGVRASVGGSCVPVFRGGPPVTHAGRGSGMPPAHVALAVLVVAIWGTNFVVIHWGLAQFPPFTFAALRFALASLPLLPFLTRPRVRPALIIAYGVLIGVGQFGLMLYAIAGHIAPGLASLLIQTQAFFTVSLAIAINGERVRIGTIAALLLCAAGIALIVRHVGGDADAPGILLVLGAALAWGGGNIVAQRAGTVPMLALIAWSSLAAVPPLLMAALLVEGPAAIGHSLTHATPGAWGALFWQSFGNTLFGYSAWNWLLVRHPASAVAPMGLLVPIFGMSASAWLLGEPMQVWKLLAAALVLAGLAVNVATARRAVPAASA